MFLGSYVLLRVVLMAVFILIFIFSDASKKDKRALATLVGIFFFPEALISLFDPWEHSQEAEETPSTILSAHWHPLDSLTLEVLSRALSK